MGFLVGCSVGCISGSISQYVQHSHTQKYSIVGDWDGAVDVEGRLVGARVGFSVGVSVGGLVGNSVGSCNKDERAILEKMKRCNIANQDQK